ncbi:hypothetical protein GOV06_00950 [Candidatus Woesearchaeota archaeon]|nr:hypothetical protein [Candidatus Woesearchaeota archaeon]
MKHAVIFLTILLLVSLAYAEDEEIFNKYINSSSTFNVNDIEYNFRYSFSSEKASVKSMYSKLILPFEECKEIGYLEFCLTAVTNETEEEDTQFRLIIYEKECIEYNIDNGSIGCKVKIGEECASDYSCIGKCLHGTCTISYPICGDSYCDKNEKCDQDCKVEVNETVEEVVEEETVEEETVEEVVKQKVIVETLEQEKQPFELKKYLIVVGIPIVLLIIVVIIYKVIAAKRKPQFEFKV